MRGGANPDTAAASSAGWTKWNILMFVLVVVAVLAGTTGAVLGGVALGNSHDNAHDIDDNDDRLDDIEDFFDATKGRGDFLEDVTFRRSVKVEGEILANSFASCPDYSVCSDGAVTEGYAVSLNEGCVTNGFDPHPHFTYRTIPGEGFVDDSDYVTFNRESVAVSGSSLVHVEADVDDADQLKAYSTWFADNAYQTALVQDVGVGSADTWVATANGDGSTVFVLRHNVGDDVTLFRCAASATALSCDDGVPVMASVTVSLEDFLHVGTVDGVDLFTVLYLDYADTDTPYTLAFSARSVADQAVVAVEAAAVQIDTDSSYLFGDASPGNTNVHLVDLQGAFASNMFGIVYGGSEVTRNVLMKVHTLGTSPNVSAPIQTLVPGGAHIFVTRPVTASATDVLNVHASSAPGTNNVFVVVSSTRFHSASTVYSVAVETSSTQSVVVYTTGAGSGIVTQLISDIQIVNSQFEMRRIECINPTTCVLAYRGLDQEIGRGFVSLLEVSSSTGAILRLRDSAVFTPTPALQFAVVPISAHHFAIAFTTVSPGLSSLTARIVRAELSNTVNPALSEIHFGLSAKGQHPLGLASETCAGGAMCSICIAGVYELPASTGLDGLGHVSAVYAYPSGQLGLNSFDASQPDNDSTQIGVHVGADRIIVRATGQFE